MTDIDSVVAGAGLVGLAIAAQLAARGQSVLVLEQENWPGQHASSRNSEVIHAGIYYPAGSLKAELCRSGRDQLYAWCAARGVAHRQIGKLVVAVNAAEVPALHQLQQRAAANGVDLQWLDAAAVADREPQLRAVAGLFSPLTGIIDSHGLMQSYEAALQQQGGQLLCQTRLERVETRGNNLQLHGTSAGASFSLSCRYLINAAGLFAQQLAQCIEGLPATSIPPLQLCQGRYFSYAGQSPFQHLVYPMPEPGNAGLGVHATLDMAGQLRFGPDVAYCDSIDYRVDEGLREHFAQAISRYWPACDAARLQPAYSGIRAKLSGPGEPPEDFVIQDHCTHGVHGLINLYGIESPGLTASLALASRVASRLQRLYPETTASHAANHDKEYP